MIQNIWIITKTRPTEIEMDGKRKIDSFWKIENIAKWNMWGEWFIIWISIGERFGWQEAAYQWWWEMIIECSIYRIDNNRILGSLEMVWSRSMYINNRMELTYHENWVITFKHG